MLLLLILKISILLLTTLTQCSQNLETKESCRSVIDNVARGSQGCQCLWIRTEKGKRLECCCVGEKVESLKFVNVTVSFLYLLRTNISDIDEDYFKDYRHLQKLEIDDHPNLHHFDYHSVSNATYLRKLVVTRCPKLTEVSGKIFENHRELKIVNFSHNNLQTMPSFRMLTTYSEADYIDMSHNRIKFIREKNFRGINARVINLSNNNLKDIVSYAFLESKISSLDISENPNLDSLSVDAFKNIGHIKKLDMSRTAIKALPTAGLHNMTKLVLKNVETLKTMPESKNFPNLREADFTYPHHCCLFEYFEKTVKVQHRHCENLTRAPMKLVETPKKPMFLPDDSYEDSGEDDNMTGIIVGNEEVDRPAHENPYAERCLMATVEEVRQIQTNIKCTPKPDFINPCGRIVGYDFLRPAIWTVCLAAIVGNICVWIMLALAYERRKRMHYLYMINMSVADMITGLYLAVLAIADSSMSHEYFRNAVWWQTGWGCKITGFLAIFGSELGIISLFLIAFEISYNTRQSFYGRHLNTRLGVLLMVGGWVFAFTMAILPWFGVSSYSDSSVCLPLRASSIIDKSYLIFGLSFNFLAFIAMALSYGFIVKMLKENESREGDRALITKMALLVATDLICWFPTLFFGFTALIGFPLLTLKNAKFVLVFFFPINAFANPFLYVFFTKVIQNRVKTKTMPVIRRITTSPIKGVSSLSNFYNSQPPGSHRASRDEPINRNQLTVTQSTSLNSTPRGSRASDAMLYDYSRSNTPRVSFEVPVSPTETKSERRKRISLLKRMVSSIPENSDLSEHSSESHHEHVPHPGNRIRSSLTRFFNRSRQNGSDSGRGSLASSGFGERVSLTSNTSDISPTTSPSPQNPPKLILPPPSGNTNGARRKSTPAIPLLVVSDFCS
ncbi:unnamed protein product [Caenorhabditis angaria]|uniref:G-protein coupled receptors family 1 profile domain-containing protein n=1 Tax=Caenorhabditis angaria TaxID=860376 RepID=A0A9P1IYN1_9PELO|nr:unnamed protein product [Caenorhabditis angaria]